MTDPTPSVPDSAEQIAKSVCPCFSGPGGPPTCLSDGMLCELHFRIAKAMTTYGRAQYERGFNEATETCDRHVDNASREVFSRAITAAAEVAHKFVARKFGANGCCTLRERILALLPKEGAK